MGQRAQIIFITPKEYWNDGNINNKDEQIFVFHNQWMYGRLFLRHSYRLLIAVSHLLENEKKRLKNTGFACDWLRNIIEPSISYANFGDLDDIGGLSRTQKCWGEIYDEPNNNNSSLIDAKNVRGFLRYFDNNNGYFVVKINSDFTFFFDIINGLEDDSIEKSITPKQYINLFYSDEEIAESGDFGRKCLSAVSLLGSFSAHAQRDGFKMLSALRRKLKNYALDKEIEKSKKRVGEVKQ
jgi:hypothetical protein